MYELHASHVLQNSFQTDMLDNLLSFRKTCNEGTHTQLLNCNLFTFFDNIHLVHAVVKGAQPPPP